MNGRQRFTEELAFSAGATAGLLLPLAAILAGAWLLDAVDQRHQRNGAQADVQRLANFIMAEIPGEPSRSEGVVDTAIRLLRGLKVETLGTAPRRG